MPQNASDLNLEPGALLQGPARIGGELRAVRERLGWDLQDVAAGLRIRLPYLQAIEAGDLSALPGAAYQTGFVRTYAAALGLDPEEILRRFRAVGVGTETQPALSFLAPVPDRAVPTGAIVMLGVVLVLVFYGLWYRHTAHERMLAAAVPSVPAELAPLAMPKLVIPASPAMVQLPPVKAAAPAPGAVKPAFAPAAPGVQASLPAPPPAQTPPAGTPAAPPAANPQQVSAPAQATPASSGQTIVATADSWVEVRDPTGNILFSRVLHAGESWPVPDMAGLTMTAGNAGATEIADDGKTSPPLGAAGAVVRGYVLTPGPAASPKPNG